MEPKDARDYMKIELAKSLLKNELFMEIIDEWNFINFNLWLNKSNPQKRDTIWAETRAIKKFIAYLEEIAMGDQKTVLEAKANAYS